MVVEEEEEGKVSVTVEMMVKKKMMIMTEMHSWRDSIDRGEGEGG